MSLIDKNEDQVLALVEEGELAFAWDVALNTKRGGAREIRVLPACVADYLRTKACLMEWADVLRLLVPDEPIIAGTEIIRVLNISSTHLYHLVGRKQMVPCSSWRRGRGGCARFTAAGFTKFLKERRVL